MVEFPISVEFSVEFSLGFSLGLVGLYLVLLLTIAEAINRWRGNNSELTRKIVHIGSGNVVLMAWLLQIPAWVGIAAAAIASIIALISYFLPILPSINSVGRKSLGTFFYAVSLGSLVAVFWPMGYPQYAAIGISVMAWGDGLAALVGQRWGAHPYRILGMNKSWEGTLTMAGASFGVTLGILLGVSGALSGSVLGISALVALAATGLESISLWGLDNLTVPLGSAFFAFYLSQGILL
jgi:phytol kinase